MDEEKIYKLLIEEFENNVISDEVKEKLHNYIKATYKQSKNKGMLYTMKLYDTIILNQNKEFNIKVNNMLKSEHIPNVPNFRDMDTILNDLNSLVGLAKIKEQIENFIHLLKFNKKAHINIDNFNLHMIFTGNPGTGKTTVARLITDILFNLGYIKQNRLTEVTAKDLIADYVGQTAGKTFGVIKSAVGGVLFIDEAYSISLDNTGGFGAECIATIIKAMEDYKDQLVIIFAGYKNEMEKFERINPGMNSRIGYKIEFPDYSLDELTQIFINLLEKNKLTISDKALENVKMIIRDSLKVENFGNARYINNLFQKILIEHAKNQDESNFEMDLYNINENNIKSEKLIAKNNKNTIGF